MALYDFECPECGKIFRNIFVKSVDKERIICTKCKKKLNRVFNNPPAVHVFPKYNDISGKVHESEREQDRHIDNLFDDKVVAEENQYEIDSEYLRGRAALGNSESISEMVGPDVGWSLA